MNFNDFKFDIIVVSGQSNAEGNGIGTDLSKRVVFENAYQMVDKNIFTLDISNEKNPRLIVTLPVETEIINLQEKLVDEKYTNNIGIPFVDHYIKSGKLENNRHVLVVYSAVGGTGFIRKEHGVGSPIYEHTCQMLNKALSLNKDNRIVAFLWHQGECDAFENESKTVEETYEFYKENFIKQMVDFRSRYNNSIYPVIAGGFCDSWRNLKENIRHCEAVEKALVDSCKIIGNAGFVSGANLKSNMQQIEGSQDNIHFSRDSIFTLGKRYFDKWCELYK